MFDLGVYDYVNVLDAAADAAWLRNEAIANNIANNDTPNYKRQDVAFESELKKALKRSNGDSTDEIVSNMNLSRVTPRTYTDYANYSYRMDGNNVDIEQENVTMAENTIKYEALINSISTEFKNLQSVMK